MYDSKLKSLSIKANFSWTLAGNVIYSACQWGLLIILAKMTTPELVGRFTLALAITAPIFMFTNFNLAAVQATDAKGEYSLSEYLGLRVICSLLAVGIVVMLSACFFYEAFWTVVFMGIAKAVESVSDVLYGALQRHERMDIIAGSLAIRGLFTLLFVGVILLISDSLCLVVFGLAFSWLVVMIVYDLRKTGEIENTIPRFNSKKLILLAKLVLPLGAVAGLNSLNVEFPRLFIERWHGERELGLFAAVAAFANIGRVVSMALSRSAAPRLSQHWAAGKIDYFTSLLRKLSGLGFALGLCAILFCLFFGEWLLNFFYGPEYADKSNVLLWVMVSAGLIMTGTFLGGALTVLRSFKSQMWIHIGKISISLAMCLVFIPDNGALAGAWVMVGCNLFSILFFSWVVMVKVRDKRNSLCPRPVFSGENV